MYRQPYAGNPTRLWPFRTKLACLLNAGLPLRRWPASTNLVGNPDADIPARLWPATPTLAFQPDAVLPARCWPLNKWFEANKLSLNFDKTHSYNSQLKTADKFIRKSVMPTN
jgi:hypothetical protein